MASAEELLLAAQEDDVLTIDNDLRTVNIPTGYSVFGVESDDDVNRIYFRGPRYYHGVDLSTFEIRVNIKTASGEPDIFPVTDVVVENDTIRFSWLIGRYTAQYKGNITFSLCFRDVEPDGVIAREFNTTTATGTILEGLETGELIIQRNPDLIEGILLRLTSLEKTGLPAESAVSQTVFATIPRGLSMGDVTGDGVINQNDANIILNYSTGEDVDPTHIKIDYELAFAMADINGNGEVDYDDAVALVAYIEDTNPIEYYTTAKDYYGNWSWDTLNHYYYYDIPIQGMTNTDSAVMTLTSQIPKASLIQAVCTTNALRICVKACPVETIDCAITYAPGNGTAIIANAQAGSTANQTIHVKEYASIADVLSLDFTEFKAGDIVLAYQTATEV